MSTGRAYLFTSPEMKIGKKEWRFVVYDAEGYLGCKAFTDYEWREPAWNNLPPGEWRIARDWPRYDGNDTHDGLPLTLRKLWNKYGHHYKKYDTAA